MLLINGLKFTTPPKNFEDFDNMFKAIDPENYTSSYIAILILDRVTLECNPTRTNEVNVWFNEGCYPKQRQQYSDETDDDINHIID